MKLDDSMAAIVTGSASGLGEATARMLAGQGVKVAVFDRDADRGRRAGAAHGLVNARQRRACGARSCDVPPSGRG